MTTFQYISYGILAFIALYLIYIVAISLVGLIWSVIKILFLGTLIGLIIWFLYKKGFFDSV
jgi:hypothetical protein